MNTKWMTDLEVLLYDALEDVADHCLSRMEHNKEAEYAYGIASYTLKEFAERYKARCDKAALPT